MGTMKCDSLVRLRFKSTRGNQVLAQVQDWTPQDQEIDIT